jgi:hypothetical protein
MATKTISDLKKLREELVDRRRQEAYGIVGSDHDKGIEKVAFLHLAIQAVDSVIEEGWSDQPSGPST